MSGSKAIRILTGLEAELLRRLAVLTNHHASAERKATVRIDLGLIGSNASQNGAALLDCARVAAGWSSGARDLVTNVVREFVPQALEAKTPQCRITGNGDRL